MQLESGPSQYSSMALLPNGSVAVQSDAGCQGHKPSDYGNKACDKSAPKQEDFFIVNLKTDDAVFYRPQTVTRIRQILQTPFTKSLVKSGQLASRAAATCL